MRGWSGLLFAIGLMAQESVPTGIVRGTFLETEASGRTGQFSVRADNNSVYQFQFDEQTYVERWQQRAGIAGLRRGDSVEVLSDHGRNPRLRYARIVRVVESEWPARRPRSRLSQAYRASTEDLIPFGTLTFSGMVLRVSADSLTLRTQSHQRKRILLGPDTRFLRDGLVADRASLAINTKVFVRASETMEGDVEAHQVVWGEILRPGP